MPPSPAGVCSWLPFVFNNFPNDLNTLFFNKEKICHLDSTIIKSIGHMQLLVLNDNVVNELFR